MTLAHWPALCASFRMTAVLFLALRHNYGQPYWIINTSENRASRWCQLLIYTVVLGLPKCFAQFFWYFSQPLPPHFDHPTSPPYLNQITPNTRKLNKNLNVKLIYRTIRKCVSGLSLKNAIPILDFNMTKHDECSANITLHKYAIQMQLIFTQWPIKLPHQDRSCVKIECWMNAEKNTQYGSSLHFLWI